MSYNLDEIGSRLQEALNDVIGKGDWDHYDSISEALKLVMQRDPDEIDADLVERLINLAGEELVLGTSATGNEDETSVITSSVWGNKNQVPELDATEPAFDNADKFIPALGPVATTSEFGDEGISGPVPDAEATRPKRDEEDISGTTSSHEDETIGDVTAAPAGEYEGIESTEALPEPPVGMAPRLTEAGGGTPDDMGGITDVDGPIPSRGETSGAVIGRMFPQRADVEHSPSFSPSWTKLRMKRRQPPRDVQDLEVYVQELSKVLDKLGDEGWREMEGQSAHQELTLLELALKRLQIAQGLQTQAGDAAKGKSLVGITRVLRQAEQIENDTQLDRALQKEFSSLYHSLNAKITETKEEIDLKRRRLADNLRQFITVVSGLKRDELTEKLQIFQKQRQDGATDVPIDPNDPVYANIKTRETDIGPTANLEDVERSVRSAVIKLCLKEAARLKVDSEKYLQQDKLSMACERYEAAKGFAYTHGVESAPELKTIQEEFDLLEHQISERKQQAQKAQDILDAIKFDLDAETKLRQIHKAESLFPAVSGLDPAKKLAVSEWQNELKLKLERLQDSCKLKARYRNYDAGIADVTQSRNNITRSEALADWAGTNVTPYLKTLSQMESELNAEKVAWDHFNSIKKQVLTKEPPTRRGGLDEQILKRQFNLDERHLERFAPEWQSLKDELSHNIGASAVLQQARDRFSDDPTDIEVRDLLSRILDDESFGVEARQLLQKHEAKVALEAARRYFHCSFPSDKDEQVPAVGAEVWRQLVQAEINKLDAYAQRTPDEQIATQVKQLREAVNFLVQMRKQNANLWSQNCFNELWTILNDQESENEFTADGLKSLLIEVKKRWQTHVYEQLKNSLFENLSDHSISVRESIRITDINQMQQELKGLEACGLLDFHNAGPIFDRLQTLAHEAVLGRLLGPDIRILPVWQLDKEELKKWIQTASNQGLRPQQWQDLLQEIEALRGRSGVGSRITTEVANELWFVALIYYAGHGAASDVINLIEQKREESDWLAVDPILCGLLAMRYLNPFRRDENDQDDKRLQVLLASLELRGQTQSLRDLLRALKQMQTAWSHWQQENYITADRELNSAVATLYAPAGKGGDGEDYQEALSEAKNWLLDDWRKYACQKLRQDLQKTDGDEPFAVFDRLRIVEAAQRMCKSDMDLLGTEAIIRKQAKGAYERLSEATVHLLAQSTANIEDAIGKGERLLVNLKTALEVGPGPGTVSRLDKRLQEDRESLEERMAAWKRAKRLLQSQSDELKNLFMNEEWQWNDDLRARPNKELADLRKELGNARKQLRQSVPTELQEWDKLLETLEEQCRTIGDCYQGIRNSFAIDKLASKSDFDTLLNKADELSRKIGEGNGRIDKQLHKTQASFSIDLGLHHFTIYNQRPKSKLAAGKEEHPYPADIDRIDEFKQVVIEQRNNYQEWRTWRDKAITGLVAARTWEKDVRNALKNGQLQNAAAKFGELPETEREGRCLLDTLRKAIPLSPLSGGALDAAHDTSDYDPVATDDLPEIWEQIERADRRRVRAAWENFLTKEEHRFKNSVNAFKKDIEDKTGELEKIIGNIENLIQHFRRLRPGLFREEVERPSQTQLQQYDELLTQAQAIDRTDKRVIGLRYRYDRLRRQEDGGRNR